MPALNTAAIRTAITEVMDGTLGAGELLTDLSGVFRAGVYPDAQPKQAAAAKLRRGQHWFDVALSRYGNAAASPLANNSNHRITELRATVTVYTQLTTAAQSSVRTAQRDQFESDLDVACQALGLPSLLAATSAGTPTRVVGGLMLGPEYTGIPTFVVSEERDSNRLRGDIVGVLFVEVGLIDTGWSPDDDATLILWGRPTLSGLTFNGAAEDGGLVAALTDLSDASNDMTQATAAQQPTWIQGPPVGLAFDGTALAKIGRTAANFTGLPAGSFPHFWAVVRVGSGFESAFVEVHHDDLTANANGFRIVADSANRPRASTTAGGSLVTVTSNEEIEENTISYVEGWINGATLNVSLNGGTPTSTALGDAGGTDLSAVILRVGHNTHSSALYGSIYEWGIFSTYNADTQAELQAYLLAHYGIPAS